MNAQLTVEEGVLLEKIAEQVVATHHGAMLDEITRLFSAKTGKEIRLDRPNSDRRVVYMQSKDMSARRSQHVAETYNTILFHYDYPIPESEVGIPKGA